MLSCKKAWMPKNTVFTAQASRGGASRGEAGRSGGSLLRRGSGRAACRAQCSQRCQFRIAAPVPRHSAFLTKPQLRGWQNRESPSHSSRASLLPRPHRTTPATRRCGEIKSHGGLSCLKPLGPAPDFGLTPGFCSELAGCWNTHSTGSIWKQLSHHSCICHPLPVLV